LATAPIDAEKERKAMRKLSNVNVSKVTRLSTPRQVASELPVSDKAAETVFEGRRGLVDILEGRDDRLVVVVGPCSIHDEKGAYEYAERLAAVSRRIADRIMIVMRVYFEKPRTTVGWKGLINDPHLNDTFDIETGLRAARRILGRINEMGVPCGTEMLEPIVPQYIADFITWASIGARTTESPTHRQMASGLSMPVGFKNATDGSVQIAIDAMLSSKHPHAFLGIDDDGGSAVVQTTGNPHTHLILRGGRSGTNYDFGSITAARQSLEKHGLHNRLVVDCSHANSEKDHTKQEGVFNYVVGLDAQDSKSVLGVMLESNIEAGNQKLVDPSKLKYGVSITDACIGWEMTEKLLLAAHAKVGAKAVAAT